MSAMARVNATIRRFGFAGSFLLAAAVLAVGASRAAAAPPVVSIEPVTEKSITSAQVSGTTEASEFGEWRFETSTDGITWIPNLSGYEFGPEPETVGGRLEGLEASTTYEVRLYAYNYGNGENGVTAPVSFTTDPPPTNPPTLLLDPASAISHITAHIAGSINPNGGNESSSEVIPIDWTLQYTPASEPEAWQTVESGRLEGELSASKIPYQVQADLTGLHSNRTYLFRITVLYGGVHATSINGHFETLSSEGPTVSTEGTTHIAPDHAYMQATVNPNEESTAFWFKYGTEDCFESPCALAPAKVKRDAGAGTKAIVFTEAVGGLQPSTTYHYRVYAENPSGFAEGVDRTFTTGPEPGPQSCPNEVSREEVHGRALPDCRSWELVSPPQKFGGSVIPGNGRLRAAAEEAPGLPMAASFSSLTGFSDAHGLGIATDYISERTLEPGTNGWSTHGVAPPQDGGSFATALYYQPLYQDMSEDLTSGIFSALSPLPTADDPHENVSGVENLYGRDDMRSAGAGTYQLLSDSVNPLGNYPFDLYNQRPIERPYLGGSSADFEDHVFQSKLPLTADTDGDKNNYKAFKFADGQLRLITAGSPTCPGGVSPEFPCSAPARGLAPGGGGILMSIRRELSSDGSRLEFSSPVGRDLAALSFPSGSSTPGVTTKLFQFDDQGTQDPADDAVIQLNSSEKTSPDIALPAVYLTASTDGDRVFFASPEQLTDEPIGDTMGLQHIGLYLWDRKDTDETQQVAVGAEGGTFTLTAGSQPTVGVGDLTTGSTTITSVEGSFSVGQTLEGAGIKPGTKVTALGNFTSGGDSTLTISQPAEATATEVALNGAMEATTAPLPYDANAAEVQSALEALHFSAAFPEIPLLGEGNVAVSGGAGIPTPEEPNPPARYDVTFTGALEGVNVMQMSADGAGLTGGGVGASVSTTAPVQNLTLLGALATTRPVTEDFAEYGMLGAGADGHRAYFVTTHGGRTGIFYWQDLGNPPHGNLSFVAPVSGFADLRRQLVTEGESEQRVTPDGEHLLFGSPLLEQVGYETGSCNGGQGCDEAYLYSVQGSTPTDPNLICISCNLLSPGKANFNFGGSDFLTATRNADLAAISLPTPYISETRNVDPTGRYVFFTSQRPLVDGDTNGVYDAYEYDTQTESVQLLSSGTSSSNSFFVDASKNGHDAFIVTREKLSAWDVDDAYDLYDVRVDGGVPEPPVQIAECEGDSCKGAATPSPTPSLAGTATYEGAGNPPRKPCPPGRRAVRRGGKTRCVKKHGKHQKRNANTNRRAGR